MVITLQNKIRIWAGILFAQFILFYLFSQNQAISDVFVQWFYIKQKFHINLFQWLPFSLGDVLYISFVFYATYILILYFKREKRKKGLLITLVLLNLLYFMYQTHWGMLYFKEPLLKESDYDKPNVKELVSLSEEFIETTNLLREKIRTNENIKDFSSIEKDILTAEKSLPLEYLNYKLEFASFKKSGFEDFMNYSGILGYYNPFTAEAQINSNLPKTIIPFTLSHERAHQLGFAREQEANFIGFLICENSQNNFLKYSAYLYTTRYLILLIKSKDEKIGLRLERKLSMKVTNDINKEKEFWRKYRGPIEDFFHITNDLFLKSNQQEGAITYGYFLHLLIVHKKKNHILRCDSKNTNDEKKFIAL